MKTFVIINPHSAAGRTAKKWNSIEPEFRSHFQDYMTVFTDGPGHAQDLANQAVENKYDIIVAVGGDGTIHEVAQGFFKNGRPRKMKTPPNLGIIAAGTGSDFVRTLGFPPSIKDQVRILKHGRVMPIDAGRLDYRGYDGTDQSRIFVNIADGGIGGNVVRAVNSSSMKGFLAYNFQSLRTLLTYRPRMVKITVDKEVFEGEYLGVIVANGRYFGGGMKVAPGALIDDGFFDVLLLKSGGRLETLSTFAKIKKGRHIEHPAIEVLRAKKVQVENLDQRDYLLDADGEQPGEAPLTFQILPKSLNILVP